MTVSQKVSVSLLISVILFAAFSVIAFTGLFDLIEARFYNPSITRQALREITADANLVDTYIKEVQDRFSDLLKEPAVRRSFLPNQSAEDIFERSKATGLLLEGINGLQWIRFIDSGGKRIHYSTLKEDILRQDETSLSYKNYGDTAQDPPFDLINIPDKSPPRLIGDANQERLLFCFPFYDSFSVYRGTAVFSLSIRSITERMVREGRLRIGEEVTLIPDPLGFVTGLPRSGRTPLITTIGTNWKDGNLGPVPLSSDNGNRLALLSVKTDSSILVGRLLDDQLFIFPFAMKLILLASFFLTTFLIILLLFNLEPDTTTIVRERLKRLQISLLEEYYEKKEAIDWNRWSREMEQRREVIRGELKRGLSRKPKKKLEQDIDTLIDKSWDEFLTIIGGKTSPQITQIYDEGKLKELLSRVLATAGSLPATPSAHTAQEAPAPGPQPQPKAAETAGPQRRPEATGTEAPEEAEAVEELEEVEEVEAVEELEEAEEAETVEELEEVKAAETAGPQRRPEATGTEAPEEAEAVEELEEVEEVEAVEELEEAEEAETVEELEEVKAAETAGPQRRPEATGTEAPEEAEAVEELEEVKEAEAVTELEEIDELNDISQYQRRSNIRLVFGEDDIPTIIETSGLELVEDDEASVLAILERKNAPVLEELEAVPGEEDEELLELDEAEPDELEASELTETDQAQPQEKPVDQEAVMDQIAREIEFSPPSETTETTEAGIPDMAFEIVSPFETLLSQLNQIEIPTEDKTEVQEEAVLSELEELPEQGEPVSEDVAELETIRVSSTQIIMYQPFEQGGGGEPPLLEKVDDTADESLQEVEELIDMPADEDGGSDSNQSVTEENNGLLFIASTVYQEARKKGTGLNPDLQHLVDSVLTAPKS